MKLESSAIGVRRVRLTRVLSLCGFAGVFAALFAAIFMMDFVRYVSPALLISTYLFWLGPWTLSYVVWFLEPKRRGRIAIEPDGVVRIERGNAVRVVPRGELESAQSVVRKDGPRIEIVLTRGDVISVAVPSVAEADAVVDQLGFGPGGRRQRVDLGARKRRFLHLLIGFLAYQATSFAAMPFLIIAMFTRVAYGLPIMMGVVGIAIPFVYRVIRKKAAAPRLEIGDDGVTLLFGNRPPRFLARKDVVGAQVVPGSGNIAMNTAAGPVMVSAIALDDAVSRAALHAIERRWSATAGTVGPRVAAFERGGRPVESWRAELASKIAAPDYRGDGLTIEEADAIVKSPGAPPDARIGAALALAAAGERVRVAGAGAPVADQRLRTALEAVAEGREDAAMIESASALRAR